MVDLTPLPGDAEDGVTDPVLDRIGDRIAVRDTYITSSGAGIKKVRSYVVSHKDGDVIKLTGGATGATFQGFFFWSKAGIVPINVPLMLHKNLSRNEGNQFAEATTRVLGQTAADQESVDAGFDALKAIRKQQDDAGINVIHEDELISLKAGETFTVKNQENFIADNFFTEREGFIQWSFGFQVIETQFSEANRDNDDFGAKIERLTEFKGLATTLFTFLQPTTPPPEDIEFEPEEEGGFGITTGDPLLGDDGILSKLFSGLGDTVKDAAGMAVIILGTIMAIFLMITMRKPLQGAVGGLTDFVKESVSR